MKVEINGGKYTVVQKPNGGLEVLRYGEPWRECTGDGLILALAQEIEQLRAIQPQRALEAAAEHVCWFDWSSNDTDAVDAIEGLRKALAHTRPDDPAQQMREMLESARDYIASVNFYAAGTPAYIKTCEQLIAIDAALTHTRPECVETVKPHIYMPDYQAMGDCRVCGHEQNKPWHSFASQGGKTP